MGERQKHGFTFEANMSESVPLLTLSDNYTSAADGTYEGITVSMKTRTERGQLCMASAKRCYDNDQPTFLIVGTYASGKRNTSKYKSIDVFYLDRGTQALFGSKSPKMKKFIKQYNDYMTGSLSDYSDYAYAPERGKFCSKKTNSYWKKDREGFKATYSDLCDSSKNDVFANMAPKRQTSRQQRRLQCAIPKTKFLAMRDAVKCETLVNFDFSDSDDVDRLNAVLHKLVS